MFVEEQGIIIDLDVKSSSTYKHTGSGTFNVSDRELKSALIELNDKVKARYNNYVLGSFNDLKIDYSVDGTSIAYCDDGEVKLNVE